MRAPIAFASLAIALLAGRTAHAQASWPIFHAVLATQHPLPCGESVHDEQSHRDETFTMTFDARGHVLTRTSRPSGSAAPRSTTYHYDAQGRDVSEEYRDGDEVQQISFTFDPQGRPLTRTVIAPRQRLQLRLSYDALGHVVRMEYDYDMNNTVDLVETMVWDAVHPVSFEQRLGDHVQYTERYFYDAHGRLDHMDRDLAANGSVDLRRSYVYDARGRLTREQNDRNANGTIDEVRTYRYDCRR